MSTSKLQEVLKAEIARYKDNLEDLPVVVDDAPDAITADVINVVGPKPQPTEFDNMSAIIARSNGLEQLTSFNNLLKANDVHDPIVNVKFCENVRDYYKQPGYDQYLTNNLFNQKLALGTFIFFVGKNIAVSNRFTEEDRESALWGTILIANKSFTNSNIGPDLVIPIIKFDDNLFVCAVFSGNLKVLYDNSKTLSHNSGFTFNNDAGEPIVFDEIKTAPIYIEVNKDNEKFLEDCGYIDEEGNNTAIVYEFPIALPGVEEASPINKI